MWVIVSLNKELPIDAICQVLHKLKSTSEHRTVRMDQDKASGKSIAFAKLIIETGFVPTFTRTDALAQNGIVECPHRDIANIV